MKINTTKKKNIQRIARRFIDMCYAEFSRPTRNWPSFGYNINRNETILIGWDLDKKKWSCRLIGYGQSIEIEI